MNYGLTIYGPLVDNFAAREQVVRRLQEVFPASTEAQRETAWQTLRNYPDFNNVEAVKRSSGDLVIHVYYSPVDVPEDADCVFHAKIAPSGTYA